MPPIGNRRPKAFLRNYPFAQPFAAMVYRLLYYIVIIFYCYTVSLVIIFVNDAMVVFTYCRT